MTESDGLRRQIGFYGLVAMCIGMNVGGGMFALIPIVTDTVGPAVLVATVLAAIPVLLALLPYSVLATGWPVTAGSYRYAKLFDRRVAFVGLVTIAVLVLIGGQPLFARIAGNYVAELTPIPTKLTAVAVLVSFYVVNLLGVRLTTRIQGALLVVMLGSLLVYVVLGLDDVTVANVGPLFPEGPLATVGAAGFLYTLMAGGLFVVDLGGEVREPGEVYAKALAIGLGIVFVLYVLIEVVTVAAVPSGGLGDGDLVDVARATMSSGPLAVFVFGGAVLASATTVNALFALISRGITVLAHEGLVPRALGAIHPRTGTPHWALTAAVVPAVVMVLAVDSLAFFGAALNFGLLIGVLLVCLGGAAAATRHPEVFSRSGRRLRPATVRRAAIAAASMNGVFVLALVPVVPAAAVTVAGLLLAAWAYYVAWTRTHEIDDRLTLAADEA